MSAGFLTEGGPGRLIWLNLQKIILVFSMNPYSHQVFEAFLNCQDSYKCFNKEDVIIERNIFRMNLLCIDCIMAFIKSIS